MITTSKKDVSANVEDPRLIFASTRFPFSPTTMSSTATSASASSIHLPCPMCPQPRPSQSVPADEDDTPAAGTALPSCSADKLGFGPSEVEVPASLSPGVHLAQDGPRCYRTFSLIHHVLNAAGPRLPQSRNREKKTTSGAHCNGDKEMDDPSARAGLNLILKFIAFLVDPVNLRSSLRICIIHDIYSILTRKGVP